MPFKSSKQRKAYFAKLKKGHKKQTVKTLKALDPQGKHKGVQATIRRVKKS